MGVYPATEVDPTGAGDCFDATFLAMLCEGAPLRKAAASPARPAPRPWKSGAPWRATPFGRRWRPLWTPWRMFPKKI